MDSGLYEREGERAALQRTLGAAGAGSGRLVVIEGPPGVGKTRLVEVARDAALEAGLAVLRARGTELEREFPFGVCLQLFEASLAAAGEEERARWLAGAATLVEPLFAPAEIPGPSPGADGHALAHGFFWLACNIAESRGGLLIAVDDAQWCDSASLGFLAHLALRLEDVPVVLLVAVRSGDPATPHVMARLREGASADELLRPSPFSDSAVERVVREAFPEAEPEFVRACAGTSGGNPFLLGELLRSLRADGVAPAAAAAAAVESILPDSVLSSVLARLAHLSEAAVALAGAAAVLGDGAPLRRAAELASLDSETAAAAADRLAGAHILEAGDPLSFTHPLIASAVEADMPALAADRAHRRAAQLLAADGVTDEAVAAHLLASRGEGEGWAVEVLARAAERASMRGDPSVAARLLTRALEEPPDDEQRVPLQLELAHAATAAGLPDADRRMSEALALLEDPRRRALAHRSSAQLLLARARYEEASDALEAGLVDVPADDPLAEELVADLLAVWFFLPGRRAAADPRLQALVEHAHAGDTSPAPSVLAPLAATLACQGKSVELVRPLAEAGLGGLGGSEMVAHGVLSAFMIAALLWVDELDLAEQALDLARERARSRGSEVAYAISCHWQARVDFRRGRLAESVACAQQALDLGRSGGWTAAILAEAQIERGELDGAREALALVERSDGGGIEHGFLLYARGKLALACGEDARAFDELSAAGRHFHEQYDFDNPIMLGWREPAALAAIRLGDAPAASRLAEEALSRARELGSSGVRGAALRAAGLAAGGERGIELLSESAAALEDSPAVLERARALVDLGAAVRRAGRRVDARDPLRRGLQLADVCGAVPLAGLTREELRAAGARPRRAAISGVDSLTPSELRVARHAAEGQTNTQIAQALFVTSKTVESHLRHAYRKLDIRSREELPGALTPESGEHVPDRRAR